MKNLSNTNKIILGVIGFIIIVAVVLLLGKFTYSYMGANLGEDINTQGEVTASGDTLIFSKGNSLSMSATTDNFNSTSGNLTDTTNPSVKLVSSSRTNNATAKYNAGFIIKKNTYQYSTTNNTAELILTVRDENGTLVTSAEGLTYVTVNGVSGFDITNKTGAFTVSSDHTISTTSSTTGTTHTWTYTLTFINLTTDQSINENASLKIDVVLQSSEIIDPITINDFSYSSRLSTEVTLNVDATSTKGGISKYYYSIDNGENYIESTSASHTFTDLTASTAYNVEIKVVDAVGNEKIYNSIATTKEFIEITFILRSSTFNAEEGMTWLEWCDSDYSPYNESQNTKYFSATYDGYVTSPILACHVYYNNAVVLGKYTIISDAEYVCLGWGQ